MPRCPKAGNRQTTHSAILSGLSCEQIHCVQPIQVGLTEMNHCKPGQLSCCLVTDINSVYIYHVMYNALCEYKNAKGNYFLNTIHQNSSTAYTA